MDRPQHPRFTLLGIALLLVAIGAALMFGQQWSSSTGSTLIKLEPVTKQPVEPRGDRAEPPPVAEATADTAPNATAAAPGGTFRGRVIDAVTRHPVEKFEITLAGVSEGHIVGDEPRVAKTFESTDGRFAWRQAPMGNWNARVAAPGYQHFHVENLSIAAGRTTREVVMPLQRGHTLEGRVFDQVSGAGIGDAWVNVREPGVSRGSLDPLRERSEKSKPDGTFVLDGVPSGDMILTAGASNHASREIDLKVSDDTPPIAIGLATGGKVAGMVLSTQGMPAKGGVFLGGPGLSFHKQLDETGSFSFEHRPAGHYQLTAHTDAGTARQEFELAENEIREDIVLKVGEGRSMRGLVRGLRPEQLKETFVSVQSEAKRANFTAKPDEHGAYAVRGLPPGRVQVTAYATMSRQITKAIDVPADKDVVLDIVFPPGVRLSGLVTQDAKPAGERTIFVAPPDGNAEMRYQATTAQDGRYEIEGVQTGEYRVSVHEGISRVVTIAGDTVVNIDLPLVQLGGRIMEEGGKVPIVNAGVHVIGTEPQTAIVRSYKESDDFGQFRLIGIEPGEILLTIYKPGYEMQREKISYSSPITNKTITLRKSAGVEVRVQSAPTGPEVRQLFMSEKMPGSDYGIGLWITLDGEGLGYLPSALAGSTLHIQRSGARPIVIERWNGQSLELKFLSH
jgi:hypothetical protein